MIGNGIGFSVRFLGHRRPMYSRQRAWLAACAVVLAGCPSESPSFQPWVLEDLTPERGFGVRTPEFEVAAGTEVQDCYFFDVPDIADGQDVWINRFLTAINPGSHHMNVFRVRTIAGLDPADGVPVDLDGVSGTFVSGVDNNGAYSECWNSAAWADWPLVANSQKSDTTDPLTDWTLPTDVAMRLTPGETMMLQVHYVNATTQATPFKGRVGINFYRSAAREPIELGTLFATQQSIRVCQSNPTVKYAGTCALPNQSVTVTAANGHFHSRGTRFRVFTWDGISDTEPPQEDKFYESLDWDDPPMAQDLDLPIDAGGGVWWTCEYQWFQPEVGCTRVNASDPLGADDCCYTFGGEVETNEHCNVFLYYWPKVDNTDIFCN